MRSYKQLTRVEHAFRCRKSVDLRVYPIHHRRAHILLCVLAYHVEWHLRQALAQLLIEDEELVARQVERDRVAADQPRPAVQAKKNSRRTAEGLELQSFPRLMEMLGTRCRQRCRLHGDDDGPTIERLSERLAEASACTGPNVHLFPVSDNSESRSS